MNQAQLWLLEAISAADTHNSPEEIQIKTDWLSSLLTQFKPQQAPAPKPDPEGENT